MGLQFADASEELRDREYAFPKVPRKNCDVEQGGIRQRRKLQRNRCANSLTDLGRKGCSNFGILELTTPKAEVIMKVKIEMKPLQT
jgi:hypothetical protein